MGPGPGSLSNEESMPLPSHPRFSCDVKNVPWRNDRENQSAYTRNVKLWKKFVVTLAETNPKKLEPKVQGFMLRSAL